MIYLHSISRLVCDVNLLKFVTLTDDLLLKFDVAKSLLKLILNPIGLSPIALESSFAFQTVHSLSGVALYPNMIYLLY